MTPFAFDAGLDSSAMRRMALLSARSARSPSSRLLLSRASRLAVPASTSSIRIDAIASQTASCLQP
jgi:hypothetical protein